MEALHKLAIHEAYNSYKYGEVELYEWDPLFTNSLNLDWTSRPAKKVILKMKAAYRGSFLIGDPYEDTDYIIIRIDSDSGTSTNKLIKVDVTNGLPFTIEGLLISRLSLIMVTGYVDPQDTSHDHIDIISYH